MSAAALVVKDGPLEGRRVDVGAELVVGREGAALTLPDLEVSRRHAVVRADDGAVWLEDLESANGTWVNGRRIAARTRLADGDLVRLGHTTVQVELAAPRAEPEAPAASPAAAPGGRAAAAVSGTRLLALGLAGALLLQLVFAASYVGALHSPDPENVPVAVAGPPAAARGLAQRLAADDAIEPVVVADRAAVLRAIDGRDVYGGLVLGRERDELVVAQAASLQVATLLTRSFGELAAGQGRPLTVTDAKPLPEGDSRGLSAFYAVIAFVFGGYLAATVLTLFAGAASRHHKRAAMRVGGLVLYSLAAGLLGAILLDPVIGALQGHFLALALLGALLVLAVAAGTAALQSVLGIAGTAVAMIVFFMVANPAAGAAVPNELLPGFWRAVGPWLPSGAGVTAIVNTTYFDGHDVAQPLAVLAAYAVAGSALVIAVGWRHGRRSNPELELTTAAAAA
ncbi:MAG TPA: FHA domain-containing protein [Gaiellaceae bacterium]|nr:FHA domain-containing protein [Gaiellaceae bacterium]